MAAKKDTTNNYPEKYTLSSMTDFVAGKNGLTKKQAKQIIEDVFDVINAGVLKGERVPVGSFGKLSVKVKPATKKRIGRNPATGEPMEIKAKPATKVPKFTFAKNFKEAVLKVKLKPAK